MQPSEALRSSYVPPELQIGDQSYQLVAVATNNPSGGIYRDSSGTSYLKTHPNASTNPDGIQSHLAARGFPVPQIIGRGILENAVTGATPYIIETSAGETFAGSIECGGTPYITTFEAYLEASAHWLEVQLDNPELKPADLDKVFYVNELRHEIQADVDTDIASTMVDLLRNTWQTIARRLNELPTVINQGDFNPRNVTWLKKVIDFEFALKAPVGYDAVSALFHTYMFPPEPNYEARRTHEFTRAQVTDALKEYDRIFTEHGLPPLTTYLDDLIIAKLIWSSGGETDRPQLQGWRWRLLWLAAQQYDPAHPGRVANLMLNQERHIVRHHTDVEETFRDMMLETFGNNLLYGFIAGRFARQLWVDPRSDLDMLVAIRAPDEAAITAFREAYHGLHQTYFYSPDRTYPGEAASGDLIQARLNAAGAYPPTTCIPTNRLDVYDGIVWAGMLKHPHTARVIKGQTYESHRRQAVALRLSWHQTLIDQGKLSIIKDESHIITYEGDNNS